MCYKPAGSVRDASGGRQGHTADNVKDGTQHDWLDIARNRRNVLCAPVPCGCTSGTAGRQGRDNRCDAIGRTVGHRGIYCVRHPRNRHRVVARGCRVHRGCRVPVPAIPLGRSVGTCVPAERSSVSYVTQLPGKADTGHTFRMPHTAARGRESASLPHTKRPVPVIGEPAVWRICVVTLCRPTGNTDVPGGIGSDDYGRTNGNHNHGGRHGGTTGNRSAGHTADESDNGGNVGCVHAYGIGGMSECL